MSSADQTNLQLEDCRVAYHSCRGSGHRRNTTERRQAITTGAVRGIDQAFGVRVPGRGSGIAVVVGEAALGAGLPILHPELPVAALPLAKG